MLKNFRCAQVVPILLIIQSSLNELIDLSSLTKPYKKLPDHSEVDHWMILSRAQQHGLRLVQRQLHGSDIGIGVSQG